MKSPICFVEIPCDNVAKLQDFYKTMFEWEFSKVPGDCAFENSMHMADHGEEKPGVGMMARQHPQQTVLVYACVKSVDESIKKALDMGATLLHPKTAVPGTGWFAVIMDPQNNPLGLWQIDEKAGSSDKCVRGQM